MGISNREEVTEKFEKLLRVRTLPLAFKLFKNRTEIDSIPEINKPKAKSTLCQLINLSRTADQTIGAVLEDFVGPVCPSVIGMTELPTIGFKDGSLRSRHWTKTKKDAVKIEELIPRLPVGNEAVVISPLINCVFEPDLILIYANPAQMILLINGLQFEDYEVLNFHCVGESSCADAIVRCYETGKPSLALPSFGERRYGHTQDDELVMALPPKSFEKAVKGLADLKRRGISYPINYAGIESDISDHYPMSDKVLENLMKTRGDDNRLLIGVTGSIATGKSTVSKMLERLGAPAIDFDILAREIVRPKEPAWQDIVDYFGKQVLNDDKTLNRKLLSGIVFNDSAKRKKLESFTHPRIQELFEKRLDRLTKRDSNAIVQVVVPLLIENNMQYLFHKILVVYTPKETQIKRLMERDEISRNKALKILNTQISIEEKKEYADYLVKNDGTLDETIKQVSELWMLLSNLQNQKS